MDVLTYKGRTAVIYRSEEGIVYKIPWSPGAEELAEEFELAIAVEKQLLEKLGTHPRIVRYYGLCNVEGMKAGLTLGEANCGDLQSYIDREDSKIDNGLRKRWSLQLAEAVAYVHENGITHMNLSTTNVLLHRSGQTIDVVLADFGGSQCLELGLDGLLRPEPPYCDPQLNEFNSPKADVFGLGVIIYIIMTGHYPFHERPAPDDEKKHTYGIRVHKLFKDGKFPDLSGVLFGDVIAGCCCERRFETAKEVFAALEEAEAQSSCILAI